MIAGVRDILADGFVCFTRHFVCILYIYEVYMLLCVCVCV